MSDYYYSSFISPHSPIPIDPFGGMKQPHPITRDGRRPPPPPQASSGFSPVNVHCSNVADAACPLGA